MYLLDTNVVSELRKAKSGKIDPQVEAWASRVDVSELHISVLTLQEIKTGILIKERSDPQQASVLDTWFKDHVIPTFKDRILPVDEAVALVCGTLHADNPRPYADSLIAATAIHHGLVLVTRNIKDFEAMGLKLLNPWEE